MKSFRAWFEDTSVRFRISQSSPFDANLITELAQEYLREEGCDPLLSEIEWEVIE